LKLYWYSNNTWAEGGGLFHRVKPWGGGRKWQVWGSAQVEGYVEKQTRRQIGKGVKRNGLLQEKM